MFVTQDQIRSQLWFLLGLAPGLICYGCSSPGPIYSQANDWTVTPVARLVSTADEPITDEFLKQYRGRSKFEPHEYNQRFRRPGYGRDMTIVDCWNIDAIGIILWLQPSLHLGFKTAKTTYIPRVTWTHSSLELEGSKYSHFDIRRERLRQSDADNTVSEFLEYLQFEKRSEMADGRYTVTVFYMGAPIYEDTFDLVGCDSAA